ncbi:MAG: divalent-cation tolerance protein CutA [Dehalococcoidales bacterium]|nr:divalent-cation tolerance protein CutA [Dehalococcoidales bacterium]
MPNSEYMVVFITTEAGEEAGLISKVLLEQRKAACISIVEGVNSMYWWQGKIDSASESLLIIKTRTSLLEEIIQIVKEIHSNDVPEIIALPIIGGSHDYLDWVGKETL